MNAEEVVQALCAEPMHAYDDLAPRSAAAPARSPGFYAWWQIPGAVPGVRVEAHPPALHELLYIGIAPRDAESRSNLRKRLSNHHRAAIGSSTFRLDLSAFLWEPMRWRPTFTDRPCLSKGDLAELASWQRENLRVQWVAVERPWLIEREVVRLMEPPLNREHNAVHPFYEEVGECASPASRGCSREHGMTSANPIQRLAWPAPKSAAVSAVMRGNAAADTAPETVIRSKLHRRGLRFRKRLRITLPGDRRWTRPDATFPRERVALFVDGCFWHGCPKHGTKPRNNEMYWGPKLARNKARDKDTDRQLSLLGWEVIRAWEHEDPEEIADRVEVAVRARREAS